MVAKELIDNALDACEEAEAALTIAVHVEDGSIVVEDNGDGINADTVASSARLFDPGVVPGSLLRANPWRPGQRAEDDSPPWAT